MVRDAGSGAACPSTITRMLIHQPEYGLLFLPGCARDFGWLYWPCSPGWRPRNARWTGRSVFSSCGEPIRTLRTSVAQEDRSRFSFVRAAIHLAESLFASVFPADCRVCGSPLTNISRLPVCCQCLTSIRPVSGTLCDLCGEAILTPYAVPSRRESLRCGLCRRAVPRYAKAVAYGSYEGALRDLIHLLKYGKVLPVAPVLGKMLADPIARLNFDPGPVVVIPVPLYSAKGRERGFNQSELIARAALRHLARPESFQLKTWVFRRQRATRSQIGLTRHQRRENLRGAFAVTRPEAVSGRQVLLIDDVFTTGTTASECARVLLRAGAAKVWVVTVARTLKLEAQGLQADVPERQSVHKHEELKRAVAG